MKDRLTLESERNEAGTDTFRFRGTQEGTGGSLSMTLATKFGRNFENICKLLKDKA